MANIEFGIPAITVEDPSHVIIWSQILVDVGVVSVLIENCPPGPITNEVSGTSPMPRKLGCNPEVLRVESRA
jgi:hypothetical protein